jgi:hypothetical protein
MAQRQGFCDCCDTYRPLSFSDSYATGETYACRVCSYDELAYHKWARFGQGFIPREAYDNWEPIQAVYARLEAKCKSAEAAELRRLLDR